MTRFPPGKMVAPATKGGMHFRRPQGGRKGFYKGRLLSIKRRRTSPVSTVSQPIGKPFNGQAKGLLWLTWRSYAGPPQYFIPPEGGALNPSGRRQPVPDRTLGAQGQRPGGAINSRPRKRASTFGEYGKAPPKSRSRPRRKAPAIDFLFQRSAS